MAKQPGERTRTHKQGQETKPQDICLLCDCGGSMTIDRAALRAVGLGDAPVATGLCGPEMERFDDALRTGAIVRVACLQEAPCFIERARNVATEDRTRFFDLRESAGWAQKGAKTGPKMAALIAGARIPDPDVRAITLRSEGRCLVYGKGELAIETGLKLSRTLGVTCLLIESDDVLPPLVSRFPIHTGRVVQITGHFGAFEVTVDAYAERNPSTRDSLGFGEKIDGVRSVCDLILDLSGEPPLLPHHDKRDGYLRGRPDDRAGALALAIDAMDMIGEFEKPIHTQFDATICAHSRNQIRGCVRCLDLCPAGAITPAGDSVAIDPVLCGGCGLCAGVCPTGAVTYTNPDPNILRRRIAAMADAYGKAGGRMPELLIHNHEYGSSMLAAMARYGRGLPEHVIPLATQAPGQISHAEFLTSFAHGFQRVFLLIDPQRYAEEGPALERQGALAEALLAGIGFGERRVLLLSAQDPETIEANLHEAGNLPPLACAPFHPLGSSRAIVRLAMQGMARAAGSEVPTIPLPEGAPYGILTFNPEKCTLCLSCVSACPAGALQDNPERPQLLFQESACVQCGLCIATCPEKAFEGLDARYGLAEAALSPTILLEDEPFACVSCGKPFGARRSIEAIRERLAGKHWMFANNERARLIEMCENCRVEAQFRDKSTPMAVRDRPLPRTTDDYLRERDERDEGDLGDE